MNHLLGIIFVFLSPLILMFYTIVALYRMIMEPEEILLDSYNREALDKEASMSSGRREFHF